MHRVEDTMKTLTVRGVDPELAEYLRKLSKQKGASLNQIIIDTLRKHYGLTKEKNPDKIEKDLMRIYPKDKWYNINYILIEHGRAVCNATKPFCSKCVLNKICPKNQVTESARI